jgi:hypothetical protein
MLDPKEVITQFFPAGPYDFDTGPAAGVPNDPLSAIFAMVGQYLQVFQSDLEVLGTNLTVQTAEGVYLAAHGIFYGLQQNPGETPADFRARILAAINIEKITLQGIYNAIVAYFTDQFDTGNIPAIPQIYVFDSTSDPTLSSEYGIIRLDICVRLVFTAPPGAWFLNESFVDWSYIMADFVIRNSAEEVRLQQIADFVRAAGTNLLWAIMRAYHDFGQASLSAAATISAKLVNHLKATFCVFDPKQIRMYLGRGETGLGQQIGGFLTRDAFLYSPCPPVKLLH